MQHGFLCKIILRDHYLQSFYYSNDSQEPKVISQPFFTFLRFILNVHINVYIYLFILNKYAHKHFSSFLVNCKEKFDRACVCPSKMKENCRGSGERPRVAGCDHWSSAKILIYNFASFQSSSAEIYGSARSQCVQTKVKVVGDSVISRDFLNCKNVPLCECECHLKNTEECCRQYKRVERILSFGDFVVVPLVYTVGGKLHK